MNSPPRWPRAHAPTASYSAVRTVVVFGGVSDKPQIAALRSGCDLLVATPGRLLDLAQQRLLDLSQVECLRPR